MHETLSIPPGLDHALATAVLAVLRAQPLAGSRPGIPGVADRASPDPATADPALEGVAGTSVPALMGQLDAVTARVVGALHAQGAAPAEVLDALEDAFAALLAAYEAPAQRGVLRALAAHAQSVARGQLEAVDRPGNAADAGAMPGGRGSV